jgi:WG containing repeat
VLRNSTGRVAPALLGDLYEVKGPGILSGLVDSTGAYVVPPIYDSIDKIDTGPDDKGQDRWRKHKTYNPDYFAVWQDGKCGVLDKSGKLVMPIKFENIASYNKGHAVVLKEGSYGIADASGKFLIEPKYKLVTMYDDVIATMDYESHWKLFDSTGKQLPTEINGAIAQRGQQWLYDGMGAIVIGDKCGFVNNKGTVDIPAKYDFTQHFSEGYGLVQENGYWSYVDKHGKKVMTMKFPDAKPLLNGKAIVLQGGPLFPFITASQLEQSQSQSSSSVTKYINGEGAS